MSFAACCPAVPGSSRLVVHVRAVSALARAPCSAIHCSLQGTVDGQSGCPLDPRDQKEIRGQNNGETSERSHAFATFSCPGSIPGSAVHESSEETIRAGPKGGEALVDLNSNSQ